MSILSKIKDDAILICPPSLQTMILKQKGESYPTLHIKLMDKENLLNGVYFTYEVDALLYIHRKYHYPYDNCKEILDNLRGANFANSKKILENLFDDDYTACIITNSFHAYRSRGLAKLNGMNLTTYNAPTPYISMPVDYCREV